MFESLEMLAISSSKSRGVYLEPNLGILLVKERFGMTRGDRQCFGETIFITPGLKWMAQLPRIALKVFYHI